MARRKSYGLDEALRHPDHRRPRTRREFIAQGFRAGTATLLGTSAFGLFGNKAHGISPDFLTSPFYNPGTCELGLAAGRKIPFICFDLAGGANFAGSNVLVGGPGGQRDFLNTSGYAKLGLPPDILPNAVNPNSVTNDFIDDRLGLLFHSESAILQGITERATTALGNINGAVIPARSENDTGNNPHNPMYGIYQAGLRGQVLQLTGSRNSVSGGNSMAPAMLIDPELRPTKIDRPSDASGLVDVGDLGTVLPDSADVVSVMETMRRITDGKLSLVNTQLSNIINTGEDRRLKERLFCEYLRSADTLEKFSDPGALDPALDPNIVGPAGIFSAAEFNGDNEFRKTASVMKLVIDGIAGAGTVTMGGYDYHTGDRRTGETRDLRAGRCIGACLEYAARANNGAGIPLMIYVFSDGSVFSNGTIDPADTAAIGMEKGVWTGDNQSTASSFFLVYDPGQQPELMDINDPLLHQQIGWMRPSADVETSATPAANNVNLLVETVVLNYLALHGEQNQFASLFPGHGLGSVSARDSYTAFKPLSSITNGTIA